MKTITKSNIRITEIFLNSILTNFILMGKKALQ